MQCASVGGEPHMKLLNCDKGFFDLVFLIKLTADKVVYKVAYNKNNINFVGLLCHIFQLQNTYLHMLNICKE